MQAGHLWFTAYPKSCGAGGGGWQAAGGEGGGPACSEQPSDRTVVALNA